VTQRDFFGRVCVRVLLDNMTRMAHTMLFSRWRVCTVQGRTRRRRRHDSYSGDICGVATSYWKCSTSEVFELPTQTRIRSNLDDRRSGLRKKMRRTPAWDWCKQRELCSGYDFDSTNVRPAFDCLSQWCNPLAAVTLTYTVLKVVLWSGGGGSPDEATLEQTP